MIRKLSPSSEKFILTNDKNEEKRATEGTTDRDSKHLLKIRNLTILLDCLE